MKSTSNIKFAYLALITASLIWGATGPVMKLTLETVPIFMLAFIRFSVASLLLFPFVKNRLHIEKKHVRSLLFSALLGVTLNIGFFFLGLRLTSALNAGILIASTPIFTFAFAHFLLKEKIRINFILGAILGITGVSIIIGRDVLQRGLGLSPLGDFLIILSVLSFVGFETASKKLFKIYSPLVITFYSFLIGAITFLPFAFWQNIADSSWMGKLSQPVVFGIIFGILLSSLSAYSLWEWGLSKVSESRVGFFLYLNPISSTLTAVLLLSERITPVFLLGSVFIFTGLFLAEFHFHFGLFLKKEKTPLPSVTPISSP
ncbi:MAG: hypothetical protein A2905_05110 [Candidatus Levybacteria bacterium RIFCSPLOWO2_01_FULL_36_10]|nr:MAG: hypothetical protein A2905_05110 [Candidatus Levybacteria bacterium RIFCSPLOWO2_01_FULL_36_10]